MSTRIHYKIPLPPPFNFITESIMRVSTINNIVVRNVGGMLLYIIGGEGVVTINKGKPVGIHEGDVAIIPGPSVRVYSASNSPTPLHFYGISFSISRTVAKSMKFHRQSELLSIIREAFSSTAVLAGNTTGFRQRLLALRHELDNHELGSATLIYSAVLGLCIETARLVMEQQTLQKLPPGRRKGRSLINSALEYMFRNFKQNPSIESIAWALKVSTEHLCRTFRVELGTTPRMAMRDLQIDEAKALIINSPLEIYRIAERTGFSSVTAFGRFFKTATGMTPTEYRAAHTGQFVSEIRRNFGRPPV